MWSRGSWLGGFFGFRIVLCCFTLFFPSNAFMASARSFNTLYGIAKALISKLTRKAVCWLRATKENWWGPVHSPISRHLQQQTKQSKDKPPKQHNNKNKNQPTKEEWLATSSLVDSCKRWQHCVISSWYGRKHKKGKNTNKHKAIHAGERSNTAPCGNQGSPQPGSPRSQGACRKGITTHQ